MSDDTRRGGPTRYDGAHRPRWTPKTGHGWTPEYRPPDVADGRSSEAPASPRRSHGLLWGGLATGAVALGCLGGAIGVGEQARLIDVSLGLRYPDSRIPSGTTAEQELGDARTMRTAAIALYGVSGALAAVSLSLIIADVARGAPKARAVLVPLPGGASVSFAASIP